MKRSTDRQFFTFLVLLLAFLLFGIFAYADIKFSVIEKALERNVAVASDDNFCSGVIIKTNLILTAAHCWHIGTTVNGKIALIVKVDNEKDLMLLAAETEKFDLITFGSDYRNTDEVFFVGNPYLHQNLISLGRITFIVDHGIHTDVLGAPGVSGSGLYDRFGRLIGLNFGLEGQPPFALMTVAVPIETIRTFLKEYDNEAKKSNQTTD